eukprot:tig00000912_g5426.t1
MGGGASSEGRNAEATAADAQAVLAELTESQFEPRRIELRDRQREPWVVRLYLISTGPDMVKERVVIQKDKVPELQKALMEHGVHLVVIDPRCRGRYALEEIDHSRPYLGVFLGERYGRTFAGKQKDRAGVINRARFGEAFDAAAELHPWLALHKSSSVFEIEITHALLMHPYLASAHSTFVYFRDPYVPEDAKKEQARDYRREDGRADLKLKSLKARLASCLEDEGLQPRQYATPEAGAAAFVNDVREAVLESLVRAPARAIQEDPDDDEEEAARKRETRRQLTDPLLVERRAIADFAREWASQCSVDIGGGELYPALVEYVHERSGPLILIGGPWSGKTAVLARLHADFTENPRPGVMAFANFVGSTLQSYIFSNMLRRLFAEINAAFGTSIAIPTGREALFDAIPTFFEAVGKRGKALLVLDGVEALEDVDLGTDLEPILDHLSSSPAVRVVLSAQPGSPLVDAAARREWPALAVPPLTPPERAVLVEAHLQERPVHLQERHRAMLLGAELGGNPGFLRALLHDLRYTTQRGDELTRHLAAICEAQELTKVYALILQRWETAYGESRGTSVAAEVMRILCTARRGVTEYELTSVLGAWRPTYPALHAAFAPHVWSRDGVLTLAFNPHLRGAAIAKCMAGKRFHFAASTALIQYFQKMKQEAFPRTHSPLERRRAQELPWLLRRSKNFNTLREVVSELGIFVRLHEEDGGKLDLVDYWRESGGLEAAPKSYMRSLERLEQEAATPADQDRAMQLAQWMFDFFMDADALDAAEQFGQRLIEKKKQQLGADSADLAADYRRLMEICERGERLDDALNYAQQTLGIYERHGKMKEAFELLDTIARFYTALGDTEGCEETYQRWIEEADEELPKEIARLEKERREAWDKDQQRRRWPSQQVPPPFPGSSSFDPTSRAGAQEGGPELSLEQKARIELELVGTPLEKMADLQIEFRRPERVLPIYLRLSGVLELALGPHDGRLGVQLRRLGDIYVELQEYDLAQQLYVRALAIAEGNSAGSNEDLLELAECMAMLGNLYFVQMRYEESVPLFSRALALREQVLGGDHRVVADTIDNLALVYSEQGNYREAEALYLKEIALIERALGSTHPDVAQRLAQLATVYWWMERFDERERVLLRCLTIKEATLGPDHPEVVDARRWLQSSDAPVQETTMNVAKGVENAPHGSKLTARRRA